MSLSSLEKDLRKLTRGEVFTDPVTREVYSTSACVYRVRPMAVVRPLEADEVSAMVAYAARRGIPVTARGAGSSVAGQALGPGIIIDFKAHMNRTLEINLEEKRATIQPGLVLADLNRKLAGHGLFFPPDPSSGDYATLGGMIANNSSGAHSLKFGDARKWTRKIKAVLADGNQAWLDPRPPLPRSMARADSIENRVYAAAPSLLSKYEEALAADRPGVKKNSSGYHLWDLMEERNFNPTPLLVGSEGTLAITVKAELALADLPGARSVCLFAFGRVKDACSSALVLAGSAAAVEIMDGSFVRLIREHAGGFRDLLPEKTEAIVLAEFEGESAAEAGSLAERAEGALKDVAGLVFAGRAKDEAEASRLWSIRKAASPILYRLPGKRLTRFVEDLVFLPESLSEAMEAINEILKKHDAQAPILGHAGDGNLHLNPRLDLTLPEDGKKMAIIAEELYSLAIGMGGSISGEHGDGMLRAGYVKRQFPRLYPAFREIKDIFDPAGVLNPGKILSDEPRVPTDRLKFKERGNEAGHEKGFPSPASMDMLLLCHGCGLCSTYCPVYLATGEEKALPRSKVGLLRAAAQGDLDPDAEEVRIEMDRSLRLCTACNACVTGCPTGVEPAVLIREYEGKRLERNGRPLRELIIAYSPEMMAAASRAPDASALLSSSRVGRAALDSAVKLRKQAPFPVPARDVLIDMSAPAKDEDISYPMGGVTLYAGCLGRYADREKETETTVSVLSALGYKVTVADLPCCGEPKLMAADVEGAKKCALAFTEALAGYLESGDPVVTACPTCALTVNLEHPRLLGKDPAELASVREAFQFIDEEISSGRLELETGETDLGRALLHRSCHHRALSESDHVGRVLARARGLDLVSTQNVCCGYAGAFGLRKENAEVSDALAGVLTEAAAKAGTELVVSGCPACRLQIARLGLTPVSAMRVLLDLIKKRDAG